MHNIVIAIQYINIIGLFMEGWIVYHKLNSRLHGYFLFSIMVNLVNNAGYLFEMMATTKEGYLFALKLSYLGRIWTAFSLFLFIMELCNIKVPIFAKTAFALIHVTTYIMVLTTPEHELYYTDMRFIKYGEYIRAEHGNGIWYSINSAMILFYIVFALIVMLIKVIKAKDRIIRRRLRLVLYSISVQSLFALVQIFIKTPLTGLYDLTMPGFAVGTVLMLVAIFRYELLGTEQLAKEYIVDKLSEGIVAADKHGHVAYYNKPAESIFPDLGSNSADVVTRIQEAISDERPININDRIYTPKTDTLGRGDNISGTVYVLQDNTDLYRHAKELEMMTERANSANKAKSSFLASMSHEIRTPINAVLGMGEMILRECDDENIISYASDIRTAGRTLLSLINDILDFSKIEEGRMEIIPAQYELSSMVNDLVNMIQSRAESKGLELNVTVNENTPHLLYGDEIRIKQCALNILTNAVKYTEKGSVLFSVDYEEKDSSDIVLKITVRDTGIGMKQEDMDKLFSPFSRIEEKRNRSIEGTGLGMSITKQLLALMDSKLDVKSVYGEGSEFSFSVVQKVIKSEPVGDYTSRYHKENKDKSYKERFHAPDARILVVDDTPVNLSVIKGLLKRTQIRVDTAGSGKEALALAADNRYDMAFIDHMMPEMDGIETLEALRKLPGYEDLYCVVLTANAVSGAREMYIKAGFSDYLSKPVDGEKLENVIMQHLPKEKLTEVTGNDDADEEENADTALPEKLYEIREINTESGLKHCGSPEVYLETLSVYESTALSNADEIFGFWKAGDITNATIKIHALKSTSRAVGADDLGALAERLEMAGKANDTDTLAAHIDELVMRYRSLGTQLSELFASGGDDDDKPPVPEGMLEKTYKSIVELSENFDIDGVALAIESVAKYKLPDNEKERYLQIKKAADDFDWDAVAEIAGGDQNGK